MTISDATSQASVQRRLVVLAISLGAIGVILAALFAYLARGESRAVIARTIYRSNLGISRALIGEVPPVGDRTEQLARLAQRWTRLSKPYDQSFVCVIGNDGRILHHTLKPEMVGRYVGDNAITPAVPSGPATVDELVKAREDWSGRNVSHGGVEQLAAYAYSPELDGLVAVHVPASVVDDEIAAAQQPWLLTLGAMGGLVPVSLALLLFAVRNARRDSLRSLEALAASHARFRDLYENAPVMYASVDMATGTLCDCNQAYLNTLGYARAEVIGKPVIELYHPDSHARVREALVEFQRLGHLNAVELRLVPKSGPPIDVVLTATAVRDAGGRIVRSRSVLRDVTEQRRSEARIVGQIEELRRWEHVTLDRESRVQELKREVNELCRDLARPARYPSESNAGGSQPATGAWISEGRPG